MEISKTIYYYFWLKVFQVEKKLPMKETEARGSHTAMECSLCKIRSFYYYYVVLTSVVGGRYRYADQ